MLTPRRIAAPVLLLALAAAALAAKLPLDPEGASLSWNPATTRGTARAKGVGSFRLKGAALVNLGFGLEHTWTAELFDNDGFLGLSGSWSRKHETARRLELVLDDGSVEALESSYALELETALANELGITLDIDLGLDSSRLIVRLAPKVKAGTVKARINTRFRFVGTSTGYGVVDAASKATLRLRGTSDEIALTDVLGSPEEE